MANIRILAGWATLEVWPLSWSRPPADAACAVLRALWGAHPCIMGVSLTHGNRPPVSVEVAIPADGSLDLAALQADLAKRVQDALRDV